MTSRETMNTEQFHSAWNDVSQMLGVHPSIGGEEAPDVVRGRVAKHIFAQANIRQTGPHPQAGEPYQHPLVDAPHIAGAAEGYGNYGYRPEHEELWTSQAHLHVPTLLRYAQGDIERPQHEEFDEDEEIDPGYEPETYHHGGKQWIAEGHHRTVADRLPR